MRMPRPGRLAYQAGALLLFVGILTAGFAQPAWASHFRFGHITWKPRPDLAPTSVEFTFVGGFRRSGYPGSAPDGRPQIGDIIFESIGGTNLNFGDGTSTGILQFRVTAFSATEDWILAKALEPGTTTENVTHQYPSAGNFTAFSASCCRVFSLRNNPSGNYRVETRVDLSFSGNRSPISSGVPIVQCPQNAICSFSVPAADADSDPLRWRLSTSQEAGPGFVQPGPPDVPNPLTVDPISGVVTWNTAGTVDGDLWSTQITVEELSGPGVKGKVAVDFIIRIAATVNNPPRFDVPPTPPDRHTFNVHVGTTLSFTVQASDPDSPDIVTLNHGGLPRGATFPIPPAANPVSTTFSWAPAAADIGIHIVTLTATDNHGSAAPPTSVTINVTSPPLPLITIDLTGCTTCGQGDRFTARATLDNQTGAPVLVEVKLGLLDPNDEEIAVSVLGDRHFEFQVPPGTVGPFTVLDAVLPGGLQPGTWKYQGALLEPALGATLSRHSREFTVVAPVSR